MDMKDAVLYRDSQWRKALGIPDDCQPHEAVEAILLRLRNKARFVQKVEAKAVDAATPGSRCQVRKGLPATLCGQPAIVCEEHYIEAKAPSKN